MKDIRKHESEEAYLIFDDTIVGMPYTDENDLICWHRDHSRGRNKKGINLLTAFDHTHTQSIGSSEALRIPIAFECVKKTVRFSEIKTRRKKRQSAVTKNEMMRSMIEQATENQHLKFRYVKVWIKDLEIELILCKFGFTNRGAFTGEMYLISNDLELSTNKFRTLYKKQWTIKKHHKPLNKNTLLAKLPIRTVTAQTSHLFASLPAYVESERLKFVHRLNHFALKAKIYRTALKIAMAKLYELKIYQVA